MERFEYLDDLNTQIKNKWFSKDGGLIWKNF
jgi:hypothetical protein